MSCIDMPPLAILWCGVFVIWIHLMSPNYRKQRDEKEQLMLESALEEFKRLVEEPKKES